MLKNLFKGLIASIIGSIIFILVINFIIGLIFKKEISKIKFTKIETVRLMPSKNQRLIFEMVPNVGEANRMGFRDYEYSFAKPKNVYRIAVIGDSVSFGLFVQMEESFPKQLEKILNEKKGPVKYEVMNLSVPAYCTMQEAELLRIGAKRYNPDFIIVAVSANDDVFHSPQSYDLFQPSSQPGDFKNETFLYNPRLSGFYKFFHSLALTTFLRYRLAVLKDKRIGAYLKFSETEHKDVFDFLPEINLFEKGFREIVFFLRKNDLPCLVTYLPTNLKNLLSLPGGGTVKLLDGIRVEKACRESGLDFLDLTEIASNTGEEYFFLDHCHLSVLGHILSAQAISKKLKSMGILSYQ
jgi:lysophospholipase L1-like esterase